MKLTLTEYEAEQLAAARSIADELNASLAGRGVQVTFTVTTGTAAPVTVCTCEQDSERRRFPPSVFRR